MPIESPLPALRIALLGYGAIGQRVAQAITTQLAPDAQLCVLRRTAAAPHPAGVTVVRDLPTLLDWQPDVVVECAGHAVVAQYVPALLARGVDAIVTSVGALADAPLHDQLQQQAAASGALLMTVTGAIGALDALSAAAQAGLETVRYTGRKPPLAWAGTPAEHTHALASIEVATPIYSGSAREAAIAFPKNANVAAAVALAGIGFDRTEVQLIADPHVQANVHELEVQGAFGAFTFRIANAPLPDNPKTSWLAALSVTQQLADYVKLQRRAPKAASGTG